MSTSFFLVRHAIKEKAIGDVSITPKGILQAQATARHFGNFPIAAIITSSTTKGERNRLIYRNKHAINNY